VIATRVGGVVDLLGETEAQLKRHESEWRLCERGVLVERGDARAFAHGLDYLIEHMGVRGELGARGREFVEREYSLERLLADVSRLYAELAGGAAAREAAPRALDTASGSGVTVSARAKARGGRG
jgi:glycosyltransferase involved in cell wall biosynthesis